MDTEAKYHPLFERLLYSGQGKVVLRFADIERELGASLPPSARSRPAWWSNNPNGHSQARAWLRAGYIAKADLAGETVEFQLEGWPSGYRKVSMPGRGFSEERQSDYGKEILNGGRPEDTKPHPLFGVWRGKVTLQPGYDYAKPIFGESNDSGS